MEDGVELAVRQTPVAHRPGELAFDERDRVADAGQVLDSSRGEIVDHRHACAATDERLHQVRSDEPGASGDEYARQRAAWCRRLLQRIVHGWHVPAGLAASRFYEAAGSALARWGRSIRRVVQSRRGWTAPGSLPCQPV